MYWTIRVQNLSFMIDTLYNRKILQGQVWQVELSFEINLFIPLALHTIAHPESI